MDELYAAQGYVELRMALWVCTSLIGEGDDLQIPGIPGIPGNSLYVLRGYN